MSITQHEKYPEAKILLEQDHSTRYVAEVLKIDRRFVSKMKKTIPLKGNSTEFNRSRDLFARNAQ